MGWIPSFLLVFLQSDCILRCCYLSGFRSFINRAVRGVTMSGALVTIIYDIKSGIGLNAI